MSCVRRRGESIVNLKLFGPSWSFVYVTLRSLGISLFNFATSCRKCHVVNVGFGKLSGNIAEVATYFLYCEELTGIIGAVVS